MSALLRTPIVRTPIIFTRIGTVAAVRSMSDHSSRHGNDPEVIQRNKESLLRKHSKGSTEEPHWHEELASDAEAFVKSQRGEITATTEEISKSQETTKIRLDPKAVSKRQ